MMGERDDEGECLEGRRNGEVDGDGDGDLDTDVDVDDVVIECNDGLCALFKSVREDFFCNFAFITGGTGKESLGKG